MTSTIEIDSDSFLSRRGRRASDQPISQLMATALANPHIISLAAGFVDNATLPMNFVAEATNEVLTDELVGRPALQYGTNIGPLELRQAIAQREFGEEAMEIADRMILTAGSNQFLHLVSECLLDEDDIVICAAPTYFVFLGLLKDMGVHGFGVEADAEGMIPESLESGLRQLSDLGKLDRVKAIYLIPYFDNPGGSTIPTARRTELLEVFDRWRAKSPMVLMIDNAYRDLYYSGDNVPTFTQLGADPDWTIESGTFSKNFSPGVRVGWGVTPAWLFTPVQRFKAVIDFGSAHLNQQIMLRLIQTGRFDAQIDRLRDGYRAKLEAMLDACDIHLSNIDGVKYRRPTGGLYVWLELPDAVDAGPDSELWKQAINRGVLYVPGEFCYPSEGLAARKNTIRLSFGVQPAEQIRQGIELLGQAIAAVVSVEPV